VSSNSPERDALLTALAREARQYSTSTVLFHQVIAERLGLNPTDHKCAEILSRTGPLTAGELADHTGLTTGAITGVVDRLERAGFVRRDRDPEDRRRHIVEVSAKGSARLEDAKKIAATVEEELLAGLDADQRAELLVLLAQVADSSGIFEGCVERLKLV